MTKAMRPNYGAKCKVPLGWRVTPVSLIFPSFPLQQDLHLRCTHNPSADSKTALQPPGRGSTLAKAAVRDPELYTQGGKRHGKLPAHAASRQLQVCAAPLQPALGAAARHRHKPPPRGKSTPTEEILGPPGGGGEKGRWRCRRRQRGPTSPAGPHDALLLQDEGGAVHQAGHHGHAQAQRHGGGAGPRPGPGALRCPLGRHPHRPRRRLLLLAPPLRPPGPPGTGTARRGAGCGGGPAPKLGRGMGKSGAVTAAR